MISTKKTLPPPIMRIRKRKSSKGWSKSLKLLGTDYIDIYHLHGVEPKDYDFAQNRLMPAMRRLKEQGKIRFIGVTEGFVVDTDAHDVDGQSQEDLWDVVMVGFSLLNPSARKTVFPLTRQSGAGVLNMFAVRRALSQPERLKEMCAELVEKGAIAKDALDLDDPLGFLLKETDAATLPEAAYRFCRHERGRRCCSNRHGQSAHLQENIAAILKPPLPRAALEKLERLFGGLDSLTGN